MSCRKKNVLGTPSGSRVRQAFRSPFRSPCRTQEYSSDSPTGDATDTTQRDKGLGKHDSTVSGCSKETLACEVRSETPCKMTLGKVSSSHTTPQRATTHQELRKKVFPRHFNAPFRSPSSKLPQQQSRTPEEQLADLIKQEAELDQEIAALQTSGIEVEELQHHIDNLHRYNEIKDAAQLVLGRLAVLEEVTLKEMHSKYCVPTTE